MKFGVIYPQMELKPDPALIRDYVQTVEDLGFSFVSCYEHILGGNSDQPGWDKPFDYKTTFLEPLVLFSFMAGVSQKLGFLTRIIILPQRQTALVAKQAATLDIMCGGRLRLGAGIGWNEVEYIAQGEDYSNRSKRLEEQVIVLRELWTNSLVTFEGKWHTIPDAGINPLPVQRPIPIWLGGHSDQMLRRVARIGDGWLPNDLSFEDTKVAIEKLRQYITEANRSIDNVGIDARMPFGDGKPETWIRELEDWGSLGTTHISFDTLGCGFETLEEHLRGLKNFAETAELSQKGE
jgi:probable F420-dependent oxidoreductase